MPKHPPTGKRYTDPMADEDPPGETRTIDPADLSALNITPGCILVYRTPDAAAPDVIDFMSKAIRGLTVEIGALVILRPDEELAALTDDALARLGLQRIPPTEETA